MLIFGGGTRFCRVAGALRWDQGVNIVNEGTAEVDESREKSGDRGHTDGWSHSSPEKIEAKILHLVSTHEVRKIQTKIHKK